MYSVYSIVYIYRMDNNNNKKFMNIFFFIFKHTPKNHNSQILSFYSLCVYIVENLLCKIWNTEIRTHSYNTTEIFTNGKIPENTKKLCSLFLGQ